MIINSFLLCKNPNRYISFFSTSDIIALFSVKFDTQYSIKLFELIATALFYLLGSLFYYLTLCE